MRYNAGWFVGASLLATIAAFAAIGAGPAPLIPPGDPDLVVPGAEESDPDAQPAEQAGEHDAEQPASGADKPSDPASPDDKKFKAGTYGALAARNLGPAIFSGRIADLAVNPRKPSEFYVAVASGNLWKTTNGGVTFAPIFDGYGSYSIGCVTLDPTDSSVVWVGSGENNSQRSVGWGDGVYVSRDAGRTFTNVGLKESEHIGMLAIDPRDTRVVYAAAMGPLWRSGGDRGLYKSTDGGAAWERVLFVSDETGINEVHLDPRNPDVIYATAYQRRRHQWTLINGGPESAIYKSLDAGKTWKKIVTGLPGADKGRIGLAISPADPDRIYAIVEAAEGGGVFFSNTGGENWEKRSGYMTTSPQYYNELFADPKDPDRVYAVDTFLHVSADGGRTFRPVGEADKHVDNHVVWIDPAATEHMLVGCDGGLYETFDRGSTWRHFENLPVMQFYRVAVDDSLPFYFVYGGTQDNATIGGPSRTTDRIGIANEDWFVTTGGDGFEPAVEPGNPDIVYSESQHAGLVRFDRRSGEEVDIRPREKPGEEPYVWNWDSPLFISPHNPRRLYIGSRVVHRSDDRGDSWRVISPDLTRKIDRNQLPVMGKIQKPDAVAKHASTSIYGNIVSLAESPMLENLLYAGTDDGLIQVTEDGGANWRKCGNFPVVPERTYVSDIEPSRHANSVVYATFDNHKNGDFAPYVLRSDDRGVSWRPITGNLPKRDTVYTIAEDHVDPNLLFVGTEFGAYFTIDGGEHWVKISGLPTIPVRDLEIQRRESDLVMATFGRGFYILDDYSVLRTINAGALDHPAWVHIDRKAVSFVERSRIGGTGGRGTLGGDHWAAHNPPAGATFTIYLKDKVQSLKEKRQEAEKKDDWKYPNIDEFRAEDRQADPRVILTISDSAGKVIRRLDVPRSEGMHRVTWNLRYPDTSPATFAAPQRAPWDLDVSGIMAPPGTYTASLSKVVDGVEEALGAPAKFEVTDLNLATLAAKDAQRREKFDFELRAADLQRAAEGALRLADDAQNRLSLMQRAASDTPGLDGAVFKDLEAMRRRILDIQIALRGDPTLGRRAEPEPPTILGRIGNTTGSLLTSTQPPTGTQREQLAIAADEFDKALAALRQIAAADLPALEARLEKAGAPWTPGRIPEWKKPQ